MNLSLYKMTCHTAKSNSLLPHTWFIWCIIDCRRPFQLGEELVRRWIPAWGQASSGCWLLWNSTGMSWRREWRKTWRMQKNSARSRPQQNVNVFANKRKRGKCCSVCLGFTRNVNIGPGELCIWVRVNLNSHCSRQHRLQENHTFNTHMLITHFTTWLTSPYPCCSPSTKLDVWCSI